MTIQPTASAARRRHSLLIALGGCAILYLCGTLLACVLLADVWYRLPRVSRAEQAPSADVIRAELESLPTGNPDDGAKVFNGTGGCHICHSLEPNVRIVGPSLSGIAARAATRKPNYSAEMYLYESIVSPDAYVVSGYGNAMPNDFKQRLSKQQLADLIAFLMTK